MELKDSVEQTSLHTILKNCQKFPTKPALHWLDDNCKVTEQYTYEEVEIRTRELAHGLLNLVQRRPDNPSDVLVKERAVLCYPPGLEFILTFLGCLRAGIIAGELVCANTTLEGTHLNTKCYRKAATSLLQSPILWTIGDKYSEEPA